jgi:hypothetical protein
MPAFTSPSSAVLRNALTGKLAPLADRVRDLATKLGVRPNAVFIVRTRWTGGSRGDGVEEVVSEVEILPAPKVEGLEGLGVELHATGTEFTTTGVVLTQISADRYVSDDLTGGDIAPNEGFYYEIVFNHPREARPIRQRFVVVTAPEFRPGAVQWVVGLATGGHQRDRDTGGLVP